MTTKEVKLWGEYKEAIEKHNRPYYKALRELYAEAEKKGKEEEECEENAYQKDLARWGRNWFTKIARPKPERTDFYVPYSFHSNIFTQVKKHLLAIEHKKMDDATLEGFLDWRLKNNK